MWFIYFLKNSNDTKPEQPKLHEHELPVSILSARLWKLPARGNTRNCNLRSWQPRINQTHYPVYQKFERPRQKRRSPKSVEQKEINFPWSSCFLVVFSRYNYHPFTINYRCLLLAVTSTQSQASFLQSNLSGCRSPSMPGSPSSNSPVIPQWYFFLKLAHIPLFLYPFLNTSTKTKIFENLRVTSLGVIGALVKESDPTAINFLMQTEIVPLCLRIMKNGQSLSKTVATFIIQKILCDEKGLSYICTTLERFYAVSTVLNSMLKELIESNKEDHRLSKHIMKCYCRLSDNNQACSYLNKGLP